MHQVSPGGFALALVLLIAVWLFLPNAARLPLAIILILGALSASKAPAHYIEKFFSLVK